MSTWGVFWHMFVAATLGFLGVCWMRPVNETWGIQMARYLIGIAALCGSVILGAQVAVAFVRLFR